MLQVYALSTGGFLYSMSNMTESILEPDLVGKLFMFAHDAHTNHNLRGEDHVIRRGLYPYIIHPMWAAGTLVADPTLPKEERILGYQILVLHDVLEDTSIKLPEWVSEEVKSGVQALTHDNWEEEQDAVTHYTPFLKLLKLCDKIQTMYELAIVDPKKAHEWKQLIERLVVDVEAHYGKTRVVVIAKALLEDTDW